MQVVSERRDTFKSTMEDKLKLQSRANEWYHDLVFVEIEELEQKKSQETLLMVQKKHDFGDVTKQEGCIVLETREEQGSRWTCSILPPLDRADPRWLIKTEK